MVIVVHRRCGHGAVGTGKVGDGGCACEMVERDDRNDEQYEDDKGDEDVDEFVDARAAVEGDVGV
jgi:hypothetical protein